MQKAFPGCNRHQMVRHMAGEQIQKVFVREDGSAKIRCESCGRVKTVRAEGIGHSSPVVRIRCACSVVFPVRFEYRKSLRKATNLAGIYQLLSEQEDIPELSRDEETINCRIENISMSGAGFSILGRQRIEENSRLIIGFTLDNLQKTWVEKTGVVRRVMGDYIGIQFDEPPSPDKDLGFYLMP